MRKKSIQEMRSQLARIKSLAQELKERNWRNVARTGVETYRTAILDNRSDRASSAAQKYASRILGRNTYSALSYSRFHNPNDSKRYTSRFYMSMASG